MSDFTNTEANYVMLEGVLSTTLCHILYYTMSLDKHHFQGLTKTGKHLGTCQHQTMLV